MSEQKETYRTGRVGVLDAPTDAGAPEDVITPEEHAVLEKEWLAAKSAGETNQRWRWPSAERLLAARATRGNHGYRFGL